MKKLYNLLFKSLKDNFITTIKIINLSKITSRKTLGPILLSLLICLKTYAVKSNEINNIQDNNLNNQFTQELLLAEFALNNNNPLKALEIYQKIALKTNNVQIAKRATELALENNKDSEALKTVAIWAKQEPNSPKPLLIASILYIQHKSIEEAGAYLLKLLQFEPNDTSTYIDLLVSHPFEDSKFTELCRYIEQSLTQQPNQNNANIYLLLSLLYDKTNNGDKSMEYINKTLELVPELQAAHINKIRLLNIYKSTDSAISYLDSTVASFPKNLELRKLYADILFDLENWNKAKKHYEVLTNNDVYHEEALMQIAYINLTNNEIKQAKKVLLRLTKSENYSDIANYYLGLISQQSGQNQDALNYFKNIAAGEYLIRGKIRIASILIEEKKLELAQQAITSALEDIEQDNNSYSNSKEIILSEAELLYQQGLYNDAMIILTNTEELYPQDQDITYSIGILAKKLNNPDLFIKNMEFVIEKEPSNSNALSALGWHYYETDNNKKAYDFLSKAYDLGSSLDSKIGARYAAVLWKMGQKEKANSIWQKAIELDPHNQALRDMITETKKNN